MREEERVLITRLGDLFGDFCKLSQKWEDGGHVDDVTDFRYHIHSLQNLVAARVGFRGCRVAGLEKK